MMKSLVLKGQQGFQIKWQFLTWVGSTRDLWTSISRFFEEDLYLFGVMRYYFIAYILLKLIVYIFKLILLVFSYSLIIFPNNMKTLRHLSYCTWKVRSAKIIPQKYAKNINKIFKYFVKFKKNEVNRSRRQKQNKTYSRQ